MEPRDKAAKFVELANKRVNKTIKDMRLISNLANKRNYDYSEEQAAKIIKILQKEVDSIKLSFQSAEKDVKDVFKL